MKKILSILAAGMVLGTNTNCCTVKAVPDQVEQVSSLDELVKSTYCLEVKMSYQDKEGKTVKPVSLGSGFSYKKQGDFYYLLTNQHVVGSPKLTRHGVEYTRKSTSARIVDSQYDDNPDDDIALEVVFESAPLDLAVLRTKTPLYVMGQSAHGDSDTLKYGEEAYVVGFPLGLFSAVTKGIVANPGKFPLEATMDDDEHDITLPWSAKKVLDISMAPGNSGGPFFIKRGQDFLWMGLVTSYFADDSRKRIGLALALESNAIRKITDEVIKENQTVKEIYGCTDACKDSSK